MIGQSYQKSFAETAHDKFIDCFIDKILRNNNKITRDTDLLFGFTIKFKVFKHTLLGKKYDFTYR